MAERLMKRRIWLSFLVAGGLFLWATAADAQTFYWRNPGRDPFLGRIGSVEDLYAKFTGHERIFAERLTVADPTLPVDEIVAGTASALRTRRDVRPESLPDGAHVAWMIDGHGVRRNVAVVGERPGYRVSIPSKRDGRIYEFHWASVCGNVTPLGTRPLSPPRARRTAPQTVYRQVVVIRPVPVPIFAAPPMFVPWAVPVPYAVPIWVW